MSCEEVVTYLKRMLYWSAFIKGHRKANLAIRSILERTDEL